MKDYYKILGLEETASAEEIHERWIELMQKYHPDHGSRGARDEEVAKEINEAYQTLKYSSSRMEYDLERLHQRRRKKFSIKKFIFPISGVTGLTFLFIFCLVCFLKPQTPPTLKMKDPLPSSKAERSTILNYETGPYLEATKPTSKTEKVVKDEKEEKVISQEKNDEIKAVTISHKKKIDPSQQMARSEVSLKLPPNPPSKELNRVKSIENPKRIELPKPTVKIPDVHPISDLTLSAKGADRVTEVKPSSLIATEEEVKRFFANYIERYNHRDIHGFLSLFSANTIQNQKDRLEGIRRIYDNFFSQSRTLQYHLEDLKMEIYQNTVEAYARYQIDQTLENEGEKKIWQGHIQWILVKEEGGLKIASLNYQHEKSP